ncbi:hypothetical protein AgCh_018051 [Apium graveolens]
MEISTPVDDVVDKAKSGQLTETTNPNRWRMLTLDALDTGNKGVFKSYGCGILMNIIQVEKDTVKVIPQILQSASGLLMAIDIAGVHFEEASPCKICTERPSEASDMFGFPHQSEYPDFLRS